MSAGCASAEIRAASAAVAVSSGRSTTIIAYALYNLTPIRRNMRCVMGSPACSHGGYRRRTPERAVREHPWLGESPWSPPLW